MQHASGSLSVTVRFRRAARFRLVVYRRIYVAAAEPLIAVTLGTCSATGPFDRQRRTLTRRRGY
jgi:hypothetical protein